MNEERSALSAVPLPLCILSIAVNIAEFGGAFNNISQPYQAVASTLRLTVNLTSILIGVALIVDVYNFVMRYRNERRLKVS